MSQRSKFIKVRVNLDDERAFMQWMPKAIHFGQRGRWLTLYVRNTKWRNYGRDCQQRKVTVTFIHT